MTPPLLTFVVHAAESGRLPKPDAELGLVQAPDRRLARAIATAQWPGQILCIQPLGAVLTSTRAPKKKRTWWGQR